MGFVSCDISSTMWVQHQAGSGSNLIDMYIDKGSKIEFTCFDWCGTNDVGSCLTSCKCLIDLEQFTVTCTLLHSNALSSDASSLRMSGADQNMFAVTPSQKYNSVW